MRLLPSRVPGGRSRGGGPRVLASGPWPRQRAPHARTVRGRFGLRSGAFRLGHGSVASPSMAKAVACSPEARATLASAATRGSRARVVAVCSRVTLRTYAASFTRVHSGLIAARNPADDVAYEGRHRNHHGRPLVVFFDVRRRPSSCLREATAARMRRSDIAGGVHARSQRRHSRGAVSVHLRALHCVGHVAR
jgi:hypothetical protein